LYSEEAKKKLKKWMDEQKKNKKAEVKKKVENEEVSTTVDTPDFSKI
jgi:hypothetical protein